MMSPFLSFLPILLLACTLLGATVTGRLPPALALAIALAYLLASSVCFVVYALDKSAARRRERRTPERTLLLLGLAGGWPGAVLAQQWLRHKTRKQPFQNLFWLTVALHLGLAGGLAWTM
jgi:uncharacterized membrane protein YsdA (DUF1294 family)